MQGILVRIGVDQAYGEWNAPADPDTREFVYVPIPEGHKADFDEGFARRFTEVMPALERFAAHRSVDVFRDLRFPKDLLDRSMHLDPDFEHLTYGDDGATRGMQIKKLSKDDFLVFYAGLRPVGNSEFPLVYSIVGLFVIDRIVNATSVPTSEHHKNAHTRKKGICPTDIIVHAKPGVSGRLRRFVPIGEWRNKAYRVGRDLLNEWGDLSVKNGYIQRSARPPRFENASQFLQWFSKQDVTLIASNNE